MDPSWSDFVAKLNDQLSAMERGLLGPAYAPAKAAVNAISPLPLDLSRPTATTEAIVGLAGPIKALPKVPWPTGGRIAKPEEFAKVSESLKDIYMPDLVDFLRQNPQRGWNRANAEKIINHVYTRDRGDNELFYSAREALKGK